MPVQPGRMAAREPYLRQGREVPVSSGTQPGRAAAQEPFSRHGREVPVSSGTQPGRAAAQEPFSRHGREVADARASSDAPVAHADEVAGLRREVERLTGMLAAMTEDKERRERAPVAATADSMDEIERVKERLRKDAAREVEQHKRELVRDFIDVLDDLDRAVQAQDSGDGSAAAQGMLEGVELVRKNFRGKLAQHGVERDPALGASFDPGRHEAVSVLPVLDPGKDGMIVGVVREGYRLGDDVLRPARVVVARAS
jgi:molecular chaperone GrpE